MFKSKLFFYPKLPARVFLDWFTGSFIKFLISFSSSFGFVHTDIGLTTLSPANSGRNNYLLFTFSFRTVEYKTKRGGGRAATVVHPSLIEILN
jgi:hypothetical protein